MKTITAQAEPHSIEAEQNVLGCVLVNNDAYHEIGSMLSPDHFYEPVHADIWKNISTRIARDHLASPITVKEDFEHHEGLKALGGPNYLVKMAGSSVGIGHIKDYGKMIVGLSERRHIIAKMREIEFELTHGGDVDKSVASLELMLHDISDNSTEPRSMSLLAAQTKSIQQMLDIRDGKVTPVTSGLTSVDAVLSLSPKRYTLLGGSTSMGKTALAIWIMVSAARAGAGAGFASLEMPEEDVANRVNSLQSQIEYKAMDRPASDNVMRLIIEAAKTQESLPIEIFSERVRDIPSILSEAKKLKRKMDGWAERVNKDRRDKNQETQPGDIQGMKLLVVDYIQLVRGKGETQLVRLSQVANDFKQVAKILDCHVLVLAQVDRKIGSTEDHNEAKPRLAHLRGSGDLEMAPDNVIFIHRPEYFLTRQQVPKKHEDRADWEAECARWKGKAEIIIGKARMGETATVTVGCDMGTNRFWDLKDHQPDMDF